MLNVINSAHNYYVDFLNELTIYEARLFTRNLITSPCSGVKPTIQAV